MAAQKTRRGKSADVNEDQNEAEARRNDDELLDQLLKDDSEEEEDTGCCKGGGCQPKLTKSDKKRLAKARKEYHDQKAKEAAEAPPATPIRDFFMSLFRICVIVTFIMGFLYLRSGAEQYAQDRSVGNHLDHSPYQTLGIKPNAPLKEIRKAYRSLSKQWHPDRNPGCADVCVEKMNVINEAYGVLSDPEKKQAYDKGKVVVGDKIESVFSVDLNNDNYNVAMASLNDLFLPVQPIIVQVFDPVDDRSQSFARIWESTAESLSHMHIQFVRINAKTQPGLVKKLPINVKIHPTVLLLERNKSPQIVPLKTMGQPKSFRSWIEDNIGPEGMVAIAHKESALKDWLNDSCKVRYSMNLPIPDDRARIVVMSQSGRSSPSAVVKRVALHFDNMVDILYASPRALPKEWLGKVSTSRNSLILLPKCDEQRIAIASDKNAVAMPRKTVAFGKTSYNDFFTNISYLLSHCALPLTRKSADGLCSSSVMGTPKRICAVHLINDIETDIPAFEKLAQDAALTDSEFKEIYIKAKADLKESTDEEDDDDDTASPEDDFSKPVVQYVYVIAPQGDHGKDGKCTCPRSMMSKLVTELSDEHSILLDLTSGFVKPVSNTKVQISEKNLFQGLQSFQPDNKVSPCLDSVPDFMNKCLVPGETTTFMQVVHYFQEYNVFDWLVVIAVLGVVSYLAMNLTPAQWCLLLFVSPMIVQAYIIIMDWLSYGTLSDFDEL